VCAALRDDDVREAVGAAEEAFAAVRRRDGTLMPHARLAAVLAH
jgi:hypothetical protein